MEKKSATDKFRSELNFFRVHATVFTVAPLIFSGIFLACNGEFHIPYIDSLFLCYSAMTVTGLTTVNLSQLTGWQQTILFLLMLSGDVTIVSLVMVLIRKRYFRIECENIVPKKKPRRTPTELFRTFSHDIKNVISAPVSGHFVDGENRVVDELTDGHAQRSGMPFQNGMVPQSTVDVEGPSRQLTQVNDSAVPDHNSARLQAEFQEGHGIMRDAHSFTSSPQAASMSLPEEPPPAPNVHFSQNATYYQTQAARRRMHTMRRFPTILSANIPPSADPTSRPLSHERRKYHDFGFFPGPLQLFHKYLSSRYPESYAKVERKLTRSYTITLREGEGQKSVKWLNITHKLVITGNSYFHTETLTDEELEEIGGVEYRALRILGYVVGIYFVTAQLITFIAVAAWLSRSGTYNSLFENQFRVVPKAWFVAFNVVGAYTGGGMSLVDEGMVPFQKAYLMIILMCFTILAGNHALPIFLRFTIWSMTKLVKDSRTNETLHFLLDHPRRCYIYLFPSEVTWFLLVVLLVFSALELFAFCVLDTGLSVTESLPIGTRIIDGLFQSLAVRASGFSIISIASLAPSVQFLYLVMMYIAVYPVAMSIRSTNVYEERSLGVFEEPPEGDVNEPDLSHVGTTRRDRIHKYLGWHIRHQLSYDLWWLIIGIWVVCIIERDMLLDDENAPWFNIFRIVFELVSAYGTIGLTLGIPTQNYSFSGACRPLSKLVIIIVMLRGRHRGLPVAVDRAVLLPKEYKKELAPTDGTGFHSEKLVGSVGVV